MQKQIKILLTILMALVLAVSCAKNNPNDPTKDPNTPPDNEWVNNANFTKLQKTWQYDDTSWGIFKYVITDSKFDILHNDSTSYSFDIKYISWTSENAGIIYGQFTTYDNNTSAVGKWYAVSFKNLTDTSISICEANKTGTDPDTVSPIFDFYAENLKEAISKFTEANGYFDSYSDCTTDGKDNANFSKLQNHWIHDYETEYELYIIKEDSLVGITKSPDTLSAYGYKISIEEISWNSDSTSGIIYGKYIIAPIDHQSLVNKYYAIAFKDLTDTTIKIASANKEGRVPVTGTLSRAKTIFTEAGGYFSTYSDFIAE